MAETNGSLMKKTKAELVAIIMRKDDVETSLRDEAAALQEQINGKNSYIEEKQVYINNLKQEVSRLNIAVKEKVELVKTLNISISDKDCEIAKLNEECNQLKDGYDEYCIDYAKYRDKILTWKTATIILAIITVIALVADLLFLL